ncbi:MAG: FHA domain-containing protein [Alphaproteobacteria bacterium]|nr:FHA domain-containing protein [Alphaproteobacteria bacterium]
MNLNRILALALAVCLCAGGAQTALAESIHAACAPKEEAEDEKIICQLRSTNGKALSDIKVEVTDTEDDAVKFETSPYSWVNQTSVFYFVVQTSGVTSKELWRMTEFLDRAAYPVGKQMIGLATAGRSFKEEAAIGSSRLRLDNIGRSLKKIEPSKKRSVILRSLEDAIEKAGEETADRRAVVVLTGTNPSESGVREGSLTDLARDKGVVLYFVSFGDKADNPSELLQGLGEKSHGEAFNVSDLSINELKEFASELSGRLENGSIVTIDATGLPADGEVTLSADLEDTGDVTTDAISYTRLTEDPWHLTLQKQVSDNLIMLLAVLGLGIGGLLVIRSRFSGRRAQPVPVTAPAGHAGTPAGAPIHAPADSLEETRILGPGFSGSTPKPLAWLTLEGSDAPAVPLYTGNLRVGRDSASDIRLTNNSVHRQHAIIQMANDGVFSIHDLGTKNGIFVNGNRCGQKTLANGDLIELGEVKLRFSDTPA